LQDVPLTRQIKQTPDVQTWFNGQHTLPMRSLAVHVLTPPTLSITSNAISRGTVVKIKIYKRLYLRFPLFSFFRFDSTGQRSC